MEKFLAVLALVLNLAGTFLLFLSFQATSSDFRFISMHNADMQGNFKMGANAYVICANKSEMAATDDSGRLTLGTGNCSAFNQGKPVAVVTAEYPSLILMGFGLMGLGFLLQIFTAAFPLSATADSSAPKPAVPVLPVRDPSGPSAIEEQSLGPEPPSSSAEKQPIS